MGPYHRLGDHNFCGRRGNCDGINVGNTDRTSTRGLFSDGFCLEGRIRGSCRIARGQGELTGNKFKLGHYPPERTLDRKAERAVVIFTLLACPNCSTEAVTAKVNAFNGKEWSFVASLASRRELARGLSWQHEFA